MCTKCYFVSTQEKELSDLKRSEAIKDAWISSYQRNAEQFRNKCKNLEEESKDMQRQRNHLNQVLMDLGYPPCGPSTPIKVDAHAQTDECGIVGRRRSQVISLDDRSEGSYPYSTTPDPTTPEFYTPEQAPSTQAPQIWAPHLRTD